jgi:hypothetical protein
MSRIPRGELLPEWGVFHVVTRGVADTFIYADDLANPVRAGLCAEPAAWRWSGSRYGYDVW